MKSLFLSLLAAVSVLVQNLTQYVVHNNCPSDINLYIAGSYDSYLRQGQSTAKFLGPNAGFFYTDANGGAQDGSATRAGFFLEVCLRRSYNSQLLKSQSLDITIS